MDGNAIRQALSVALVVALLGLALWKLRRGGVAWRRPSGRSRAIESVERLGLTPQHSLHLVRVHGREIVVATHPHGCTVLEGAGKGAGA